MHTSQRQLQKLYKSFTNLYHNYHKGKCVKDCCTTVTNEEVDNDNIHTFEILENVVSADIPQQKSNVDMNVNNTDSHVDNSDVTLADKDMHMNMDTKMEIGEDSDEDIGGHFNENADSEVFNDFIQHKITETHCFFYLLKLRRHSLASPIGCVEEQLQRKRENYTNESTVN